MRVLLVEDEKRVSNFIMKGLREEGFAVDVAVDGSEALEKSAVHPYRLIVLDVMIPDPDGMEVCRRIRKRGDDVPILMLTARGTVRDKVMGLNSGADDYLLKPFEFEELLARCRALIRRRKAPSATRLSVADLTLDQTTHEVLRARRKIDLTAREYALLQFLMLNAGQLVTRTAISEQVWNESFDSFTNVIDVYINYLRKKIDDGRAKPLIRTVRGQGYMLADGDHDRG